MLYVITGYSLWDSTVIHTAEVIPRFVVFCAFPGAFCAFLSIRIYHAIYVVPVRPNSGRLSFVQRLATFGRYLHESRNFTNISIVYLFRYYMLYVTVMSGLSMFLIQSFYSFVLPVIWRIHFIGPYTWEMRFRLLTVQLMTIPLIIGSILALFIWPSDSTKSNKLDPVYQLKLSKEIGKSESNSRLRTYQTLLSEKGDVFSLVRRERDIVAIDE
jgi:hypothetical protein